MRPTASQTGATTSVRTTAGSPGSSTGCRRRCRSCARPQRRIGGASTTSGNNSVRISSSSLAPLTAPACALASSSSPTLPDASPRLPRPSPASPPQAQAESVVALLEQAAAPKALHEILRQVNIRQGRLEAMLKILEVEGAVERPSAGRWRRTLREWSYDTDRVERVTAARRHEQAAMRRYAETTSCLMAFLRQELADPDPTPFVRCVACT